MTQVGERQTVPQRYGFQKVVASTVAAAALLEASVGGYAVHDIAEDILRQPTGQEQLIAHALGKVSGEDPTVRCVTSQQIQDRVNWGGNRIGIHTSDPNLAGLVPLIPYAERPVDRLMYLRQDVCGKIISFMLRPPTNKEEIASRQVEDEIANGLVVAAHEDRHVEGMEDETGTQCQAMQTVGELAVALGMSPSLANDITSTAVWVQGQQEHRTSGSYFGVISPDSPYFLGFTCRPGGKYDMRIIPSNMYPNSPGNGSDSSTVPNNTELPHSPRSSNTHLNKVYSTAAA